MELLRAVESRLPTITLQAWGMIQDSPMNPMRIAAELAEEKLASQGNRDTVVIEEARTSFSGPEITGFYQIYGTFLSRKLLDRLFEDPEMKLLYAATNESSGWPPTQEELNLTSWKDEVKYGLIALYYRTKINSYEHQKNEDATSTREEWDEEDQTPNYAVLIGHALAQEQSCLLRAKGERITEGKMRQLVAGVINRYL